MADTSTYAEVTDRIRRCTVRLTELTGIEFSFGYLGNDYGSDTSDRTYYLFAAHPGRVGTDADRLGGVKDPADLLPILSAALQLARVLSTPR